MWIALAPTSVSRDYNVSFILNGFLYAVGGGDAPSSVERYDVASDTWTVAADILESRTFFSAVTVTSTGPVEEQDLFDALIVKASMGCP
jgi:hypothetical protein